MCWCPSHIVLSVSTSSVDGPNLAKYCRERQLRVAGEKLCRQNFNLIGRLTFSRGMRNCLFKRDCVWRNHAV
ncbi:hypothetical protein DYJ25_08835 [Prevotella denticola]|nr:hypothetical protein DYJ25_08835 [Prevotella denticola]